MCWDYLVLVVFGGDVFGLFEVDWWGVICKWCDLIGVVDVVVGMVVEFFGGFGEEIGVGEVI